MSSHLYIGQIGLIFPKEHPEEYFRRIGRAARAFTVKTSYLVLYEAEIHFLVYSPKFVVAGYETSIDIFVEEILL
jgi:hypothetical protein